MPRHSPDKKLSLDAQNTHTSFDLSRTPLDRGTDQTLEREPLEQSPLPFYWPETHIEPASLGELTEQLTPEECTLYIHEGINRYEFVERSIPRETWPTEKPLTVTVENLGEPSNAFIRYKLENADIFYNITTHRNGMIAARTGTADFGGGIMLQTEPDQWIRIHRSTEDLLSYPAFHPDGSLLIQRSDGIMLKRHKDGSYTMLQDPDGHAIEEVYYNFAGALTVGRKPIEVYNTLGVEIISQYPDASYVRFTKQESRRSTDIATHPDGTIAIVDTSSFIYLIKTDGTRTTVCETNRDRRITNPNFHPNGALVAERRVKKNPFAPNAPKAGVLYRTPKGDYYALTNPFQDTKELYCPTFTATGDLLVGQRGGYILKANTTSFQEGTPFNSPASTRRRF